MNSFNLAILHHALGRFGGAEKLSILHSMQLKDFGVDVEFFYNGPIYDDWKERLEKKISFNILPFGFPYNSNNLQKIFSVFKKLDFFDKILIHHHIDPFLAYYLSKKMGSKIIWYCGEPLRALWEDQISGINYKTLKNTVIPTSRDTYGNFSSNIFLSKYIYPFSIKFLRALDISTIKKFSKIITNSYYTKRLVKKVYGIDDDIDVVYPGIEIKRYDEYKQTVEEDQSYILSIGSLIPMKNYINLLKAVKILKNHDQNIKLLIIGDGPLKSSLDNIKLKMNLHDVFFMSNLSEKELIEKYINCRFVVHIALYEPFGLVPIEAGFFEKPSVVSNLGGTKETVINGETGFLVNPNSPEEIAFTMMKFLKDKPLLADLGKNARKRVINNFSIKHSCTNLVNILDSL